MGRQSAAGEMAARVESGGAVVSVGTARRVVLYLLAFWTAMWGFALVFAAGAGSLGAGIDDKAAQRLLGVHVLILVPLYGLLALNPSKYRAFLWVPYVSQAAITLVILFDLLAGNRDSPESVLPMVVAVIFFALLAFLWQAGRRPAAAVKAAGAKPMTSGRPRTRASAAKATKAR